MAAVGQENDNSGHAGGNSQQMPVPAPLRVADFYTIRWELSCKSPPRPPSCHQIWPVLYINIIDAPMPKMQYGLHLIESQQLGTPKADQLLLEFYSGVKDDGQDPNVAKETEVYLDHLPLLARQHSSTLWQSSLALRPAAALLCCNVSLLSRPASALAFIISIKLLFKSIHL